MVRSCIDCTRELCPVSMKHIPIIPISIISISVMLLEGHNDSRTYNPQVHHLNDSKGIPPTTSVLYSENKVDGVKYSFSQATMI